MVGCANETVLLMKDLKYFLMNLIIYISLIIHNLFFLHRSFIIYLSIYLYHLFFLYLGWSSDPGRPAVSLRPQAAGRPGAVLQLRPKLCRGQGGEARGDMQARQHSPLIHAAKSPKRVRELWGNHNKDKDKGKKLEKAEKHRY